jgi:hypothetical protein
MNFGFAIHDLRFCARAQILNQGGVCPARCFLPSSSGNLIAFVRASA